MEYKAYKEIFDLEEYYWWFVGRRKIVFSLLEEFGVGCGGGLVLDAGCGTGINIKELGERCGTVFGIDVSSDGLGFCMVRGIRGLVRGSIEELPFKSGCFSLVTCFGVIYHKGVVSVGRALGEFERVCGGGGYVVITTPAFGFLSSRHDLSQDTLRRFTLGDLSRAVSSAGLSVRKITYWTFFLFPLVFVVRKILNIYHRFFGGGSKPPESDLSAVPPFLNSLLIAVMGVEAQLIKRVDFPLGVSLLCIAQKIELIK